MLYLITIIFAILSGILLGLVKNKKFIMPDIKLKKIPLATGAFLIQTISRIIGVNGFTPVVRYSFVIQFVVFVLLFICLWHNRKYIGFWMVGTGAFANALVMMFNGGKMPVDTKLMKSMGLDKDLVFLTSGIDNKHTVLGHDTSFNWLADIIPVKGFLGYGMPIVSIGDIVVLAGLVVLIWQFLLWVPCNIEN